MKARLQHLLRQRHLLREFVRRDLQAKYVGAAGGVLWAVVHPLLLLVVYTFVFSVVLRVRFGEEAGVAGFALYLYCGMLPWHAFADAVARSTPALVQHRNLLKNIRFPAKVLPVTVALSELVTQAIGTVFLAGALLLSGRGLSPWLLLLPILVALQLAFTVGLSLALSTAEVFFRDTQQFVRVGLLVWMFLTPIFYPESRVPEGLRWLVQANPMARLVRMHRDLMLEGAPFAAGDLLWFGLAAAAMLAAGYAAFTRSHHRFADVI